MEEQVYLASVGDVELFDKVNGAPRLFATAHTLTESAINISVSAEEIRGGKGGQLLGQFFHTSQFGCSLTDTMFKLEYVAAQVGGELENGGEVTYEERNVALNSGKITLKKVPVAVMPGTQPIVWYKVAGDPSARFVYHVFTTDEITGDGASFAPIDAVEGNTYCLKYLTTEAAAKKLIINANFVPKEFTMIMVTDLFAGSAAFPESGRKIGTVTVKIPRFKLNGTMDLSMAMASAVSVQLQGTALAYTDDCDGAKYAEMTEFVLADLYQGYEKVVIDAETNVIGATPVFYLVGTKKTPTVVPANARIYNGTTLVTPAPLTAALPADAVYSMVYDNYEGKRVAVPATFTPPSGD